MASIFINALGEDLKTEYNRNGKGYSKLKVLSIDELANGSIQNVDIVDEDDTLIIKKTDDKPVFGKDPFLILCREFGVVDGITDKAKFSVIFLEDGYMLLKQISGDILLNIPTKENKVNITAISNGNSKVNGKIGYDENKVEWINSDLLMNYIRHYVRTNNPTKGKFPYEFEHIFTVDGMKLIAKGLKIKFLIEEDNDISRGFIAAYEQEQKHRDRAKELENKLNSLHIMTEKTAESRNTVTTDDSFDEDDENEDEDSWDD